MLNTIIPPPSSPNLKHFHSRFIECRTTVFPQQMKSSMQLIIRRSTSPEKTLLQNPHYYKNYINLRYVTYITLSMNKIVISLFYILGEPNYFGYFWYCPIIAYILGRYYDDYGTQKLKVLREGFKKKKIVEFFTKKGGGGSDRPIFH